MKISIAYIFVILILTGCEKRNTSAYINIQSEEYEVYSSVIDILEPLSIPSKYRDKILFLRDSSILPYSLVGYYDTSQSFSKRPTIADSAKLQRSPKFESIDVFALLKQEYSEYDWNYIHNSFDEANKYIARLDSAKISWHIPGCLMSNHEFYLILHEDSTSEKYRAYRDSFFSVPGYSRLKLIQLSRVGFDPSNSLAVVFYDSGRPGGRNYGFFVLKKESSKWVAVKRLWIGYM